MTTRRSTRTVYATDNSVYQLTPASVATPQSVEGVVRLVQQNLERAEPRAIAGRGGGTGTNGQSLTDGLMIDFKRSMHEVVQLDLEVGTAIVQPGLVAGELNDLLRPHGLHWAPHTSTLNRATVGGMISTDAAGKGSLVHGRAHRHVDSLRVVLDDGTLWSAEEVPLTEAKSRAAGHGRGADIWRALLDLEVGDRDALGLPELARGFSGYGVHRLRQAGMIDPVALLCGAEGTLGLIVEATLRLTPLPSDVEMLVAGYVSFDAALHDAVALRSTGPLAIECFDRTTLDAGRASPAWEALAPALADGVEAVLVLEYEEGAALGRSALEERRVTASVETIVDAERQRQIWKVRADAVGLLAKVVVGEPAYRARPTAFVEDCAVPVESMPAFIADFRQVLDEAGLIYGMFGHADVGCVHVRPALDLRHPQQRAQLEDVTAKVRGLVDGYGGILWGEHGRGFRGGDAADVLGETTHQLMRRVKSIFDPGDLFNPGKLYRPLESPAPLLDVGDPPFRGERDAEVPVQLQHRFESAFACNGNGLCHHHSASEVMCPSFKASLDPALSPKGRADLLREWLREPGSDKEFEGDLATNLGFCLSCSACTGRCPVEVDIPELKSKFLADYYSRARRPPAHRLMATFETLAVIAARLPQVAGAGMKLVERALGLVDLPSPRGHGSTAGVPFRSGEPADVVILPDVFTGVLEPETLAAAAAALRSVGYSVAIADVVPSGKYEHVKGMRKRFRKRAQKQRRLVDEVVANGSTPVVIEPAVALLHGHEYARILELGDRERGQVLSLGEAIAVRSDRLAPFAGVRGPVTFLAHCTEQAMSPDTSSLWAEILRTTGFDVETPDVGCCGMAGVFGHEREHRDMSRSIWDLAWAEALEGSGPFVAPGYSCRTQAKRFADRGVVHPVHLLAEALGSERS